MNATLYFRLVPGASIDVDAVTSILTKTPVGCELDLQTIHVPSAAGFETVHRLRAQGPNSEAVIVQMRDTLAGLDTIALATASETMEIERRI